MFAILLQTLLLPAGRHLGAETSAGSGGNTIAGLDIAQNLCRAGSTTSDDPGKAPLDHQQCCALCLAAHAVASFTPPSAPAIPVARDYGIVVPTETALILPGLRSTLRRQQPRAPPVFI